MSDFFIFHLEENDTWYYTDRLENGSPIMFFRNYHDIVDHFRKQVDKVKLFDNYHVGFINLDNGNVVGIESNFGLNDDILIKHWTGRDINDNEKTRYSKYDVYLEDELL